MISSSALMLACVLSAACGRFDFDPLRDSGTRDANGDDATDSATDAPFYGQPTVHAGVFTV